MNEDRLIYLLDTNVCIIYLKGKSSNVDRRLKSINLVDRIIRFAFIAAMIQARSHSLRRTLANK
jgi:predicted nucleic acid-binding protein